jgi:hypothetical protein
VHSANKDSASLFPIFQTGKYGYIDSSGVIVIPPQFARAKAFSEGLAAVAIPNAEAIVDKYGQRLQPLKWGFIDETGEIVIPPRFSEVGRFSEGLAWVEAFSQRSQSEFGLDEHGYIDRSGKIVIPTTLSFLFEPHGVDDGQADFKDGLALIKQGGKYGFIDKTGRRLPWPNLDEARAFSEGLAMVRIGDKYGFVDTAGRLALKPQFDYATSFAEGLALVRVGDEWRYINTSGETVLIPEYSQPSPFSEGLALVTTERGRGYINTEGDLVIEIGALGPAGAFSDGMAMVGNGPKTGYIDKSGRMIVEPQFAWAEPFSGGLARVHPTGSMTEYSYIDRTGKLVWQSSL